MIVSYFILAHQYASASVFFSCVKLTPPPPPQVGNTTSENIWVFMHIGPLSVGTAWTTLRSPPLQPVPCSHISQHRTIAAIQTHRPPQPRPAEKMGSGASRQVTVVPVSHGPGTPADNTAKRGKAAALAYRRRTSERGFDE